jgi:hypothetical protein
MRFPLGLVASVFAFVSAATGTAHADDAPDALDELKQGYALKQAGRCQEAIAHFARSFDRDPTAKALLNRADCEAKVGDLAAAQDHAAQGRQLAIERNDAELAGLAAEQLAAIEKKIPHLTITMAPNAPANCTVSRDGVPVDPATLGAAVGVNPGEHAVVANASGYPPRTFYVTLAEGETARIKVQPGAKLASPAEAATSGTSAPPESSHGSTGRLLAFAAGGIGVAGLVVGIATGIAAATKHGTLESHCAGNNCPPSEQSELDSFHTLRTASTVAYAIGLVGIAGGAVLWLTVGRPRSNGAGVGAWLGPASAGVGGSF